MPYLTVTSLNVPDANGTVSMPGCYVRAAWTCSYLCNLSCCFPLSNLWCYQKLCLHMADWMNCSTIEHRQVDTRASDACLSARVY